MAENRRPIVWSSDARSDLAEIWDYHVTIAGPHTANRIVREIGERCHLLEDHPFAGRARDEVRPGLRSLVANPYVIFYRVAESVTEIVRVLDGRRDLDEIFSHDA
jgi:toxin ParE1/3/4